MNHIDRKVWNKLPIEIWLKIHAYTVDYSKWLVFENILPITLIISFKEILNPVSFGLWRTLSFDGDPKDFDPKYHAMLKYYKKGSSWHTSFSIEYLLPKG